MGLNPTEQIFGGIILGVIFIIFNLGRISKFIGWLRYITKNKKNND